MIFSFKLKKSVYNSATKEGVLSKVRTGYTSSSRFGNTRLGTYTDSNGVEYVMVYTLQKYKKKTSQVKVKSKKDSPYPMTTKSTVLNYKHWKMNVYYIPIQLLVSLGKKVDQLDRTFVIKTQR
jgi:hypothetical protein